MSTATLRQKPSVMFKDCPYYQALSKSDKIFVLNYAKDQNITRSYKRAHKKVKTRSAASMGSLLLTKLNIQAALKEITDCLGSSDIADAQELRAFWTRLIRGNITDVISFNEDGMIFTKNSDELAREVSGLIKKIKVTTRKDPKGDWTETETNLELHDPQRASELMARSLGILTDKLELSGGIDLAQLSEAELIELTSGKVPERFKS